MLHPSRNNIWTNYEARFKLILTLIGSLGEARTLAEPFIYLACIDEEASNSIRINIEMN